MVQQEVVGMTIKKLDLDLIPQLKSKEVRAKRKVLARILEGSWTALLKGRGMEFAGFRKYTYGDDASRIDWGASLRAKDTLIREFEEYKSVNVLFVLDLSNTMLFSSQKKMKAEYAAEVVFNLAVAILDNGDSVGYVLFNTQVVAKSMPNIGKEAIYDLANSLSNPKNYGGGKDLKRVVSSIDIMLKQRALIILVSDFIGMQPGWESYIKMLAEKFDLIGIMIRDPRDRQFPEQGSQFLLEDPFSQERMYVDVNEYRHLFEKAVREEERAIKGVFDAAKAGFISISTGDDMLRPILDYFKRRSNIVKS
ncbi:TPA: DUF58 domain-containing protein [Candidatus Woesearchaeota archaeon]|nr:DUF58 domain-containing protein [Candidatus Woesearchaeota archaeon]